MSLPKLLFIVLFVLFSIPGCLNSSNNKEETDKLKSQITQIEKENQQLKEENEKLKKEITTLNASQVKETPPVEPNGVNQVSSGTETLQVEEQKKFDDIKSVFGEKEIEELSELGVFGEVSGKFNPKKPVKRAEFVRWLVIANNKYFSRDSQDFIRLADGGGQTFKDIPPDHPDYPYIQGMADSGFVVGYDETTFKPERYLSREEMIAIKAGRDLKKTLNDPEEQGVIKAVWNWTDSKKVSKRYVNALHMEGVRNIGNVERVFGAIRTFHPQKNVTRAEAAVCIWKIGHYSSKTAEQILKEINKE